jgi:FKBP-type peptidyl-prolyl cis-trans isomerase FklB
MYLGQGWKRNGMDVDPDLVARGIKDVQSTNTTLMTQQDAMSALNDLRNVVNMNRQKVQAEEAKEQAEAAQKNAAAGDAFLAANKTKTGVVTLPDGLQYKILSEASGDLPAPDDVVTVNYRGTFVDGTEFDSSARAGHPAQFPVNRVIPGWTEALEKMTVGSKWELYIPANLAYGAAGRPPVVGPNQTLIFDVELLSATHPAPPAPRQPLTSDIIKVPSAEEMKNGAKIETIKASDLQKMQQEQKTNQY